MFAKMRMQVGETVISWGSLPDAPFTNARSIQRPVRPKFAVIEGGRRDAPASVGALPLQARSA